MIFFSLQANLNRENLTRLTNLIFFPLNYWTLNSPKVFCSKLLYMEVFWIVEVIFLLDKKGYMLEAYINIY